MNPLAEQLTNAYRREEELYRRILDLVARQERAVQAGEGAGEVRSLCGRIEQLMAEIAEIEQGIEPAKEKWKQGERESCDALEDVLTSIEEAIDQIAGRQRGVQEKLLERVRSEERAARQTRGAINARKATRLYGGG